MDFRTFWHHIITNLQTSAPGLEFDLRHANFGKLLIRYKGSTYVSGICIKRGKLEAQVYIKLRKPIWSPRQDYHFTPGNANEDPRAVPDKEGEANAVVHATEVRGTCSPQLARGFATWISYTVEKLHKLEKTSESDDALCSFFEDLDRLKSSADAGNVDDLNSALVTLQGNQGLGLISDNETWLTYHAERGNALAQRILGTHILDSDSGKDSDSRGLNLLKQAAGQLCPEAAYELAKRYGYQPDNDGLEVDDDRFFYHYDSPERSKQEHWHWLCKAAELGHPLARADFAYRNLHNLEAPIPREHQRDIAYCLAELRELATSGIERAISILVTCEHLDDYERFSWAAHGAYIGSDVFKVSLSSHLKEGKGSIRDTQLAIKWLRRAYTSSDSPDNLLKLAGAHFDSADLETVGLFKSLDAWKRYEACYPYYKYSYYGSGDDLRWVRFKVKTLNGHLLVQVGVGAAYSYILDTGSATSPTLDELDARFPGIKEHIHKTIGTEIKGIFGNDQIMSGNGFVLDMREGDTGTLWIVDPTEAIFLSDHLRPTCPDRLPALSVRISKNSYAFGSFKYDDTNLAAYLDTGAQHSYLNHPINEGKGFSDFTVLGGFFEKFTSNFQPMDVKTSRIRRTCAVGNLPVHLTPQVFKHLGVDAIIGNELLHGAILCWRKRDNLLHIQDGIHADLIEQFIGTELNAPPEPVPSRFECYLLGLDDYGPESFNEDILSVVPKDNQHLAPNGTTSFNLNIIYFDKGGKTGHLTGSRRTLFIVACYFKVLIDQVFHHHFNAHHAKYESLGDTVKLTLLAPNINPSCLLDGTVRHDPAASAAFVQARTFFESHVKEQVRAHFPALSPDEVWKTVNGYLPTRYPYLS